METITIPSGTTRKLTVGDGETFENKLIDITNPGAVCRVVIQGHNTTVRNVGWRGTQDAQSYAVLAVGGDASGDVLIENVYMGDGSNTADSAGNRDPTAIWASPDASGNLTVRNVNVQGWNDNGMYLSNPSNMTVTIERCYASDCNNAEYRLGSEGSVVRDSVVWNGQDRGVWGWGPATTHVENCHIHMQGGAAAFWSGEKYNRGATIEVSGTEWDGAVKEPYGTVNFLSGNGRNPQNFLPAGCPATPEEAAQGGGSDPFEGVEVVVQSDADSVQYVMEGDGDVRKGADAESTDEVTRSGDTWTVDGVTGAGYSDNFLVDGQVTDFRVTSDHAVTDVNLTLDGKPFTVGDLPVPPIETDPCGGCPDGLFCLDGECVECEVEEDCPDGMECQNGECVDPTGPCDGVECGECLECIDGDCVVVPGAECVTDADCPEGVPCVGCECQSPDGGGRTRAGVLALALGLGATAYARWSRQRE